MVNAKKLEKAVNKTACQSPFPGSNVGMGLSPRQEPPLCGGCAPKRACGRSDPSLPFCGNHQIPRRGGVTPPYRAIKNIAR